MALGNLSNAVTAYLRCGNVISAVQTCEALADAHPNDADHWLQEAAKHLRKAKKPVQGFELLLRHPRLKATLPDQVLQPCCIQAALLVINLQQPCGVRNLAMLSAQLLTICNLSSP